jgi:hypothetical protein
MKKIVLCFVVGLMFSTTVVAATSPFGWLVSKTRTFQVVDGLIAENKHTVKEGVCKEQLEKPTDCWGDDDTVLANKGKPTRVEKYTDFDADGNLTNDNRKVYYYDSANQTEVYVLSNILDLWFLTDDYITSTIKFSATRDRFARK